MGVTEVWRTFRLLSKSKITVEVWRLWVPYAILGAGVLMATIWAGLQSYDLDRHVEDAHRHICAMTAEENAKLRTLAFAGGIDRVTVDQVAPALSCKGEVLFYTETGAVFVDFDRG